MEEVIRNFEDRVVVVENQLTNRKSNIVELKGMMSTILKHIELKKNVRN